MTLSLEDLSSNFERVTNDPAQYLSPNKQLVNDLKNGIKNAYDFTKKQHKLKEDKSLPTLIINNFDIEQIWQQINLQNDGVLNECVNDISRLLVNKDQLICNQAKSKLAEQQNDDNTSKTHSESDDESELSEDEGEDDLQYSEESGEEKEDVNEPESASKFKPSVVDDDFFKLNEMEAFLNKEESKGDNADSGNDSDSENEDRESVNMFEDDDDEDGEENDARMARFKDYFVSKDESEKRPKRKRIDESDDEEEEKELSTFEKRQGRLKKKIEQIEDQAVSEKPWQLKGEVTAEGRPQNSLLEEIVEFDLTSRPAPVITEQTSLQLEDIIKQRIKDKVFDSVERKQKPVESMLEYKKKLVLDQEKSKQSLAQIYEKEYLDKQAELDPDNADKEEEEPELHKEIKKLMTNLFSKLNALSNYHFTANPSVPELKIVSNLPAINMEEVAPVAVSDAALLAPEEVRHKLRGDMIGESERTKTDKKRNRRRKKQKQKMHSKLKQKKEARKKIVDGVPKKYGQKKKTKNN